VSPRAARIAVRRARASDLDAIAAMRLALLEESRDNPAHRRLRRDIRHQARPLFALQLQDARCLTLVAELAGEPVGVLRCMLSSASPLYDPPRHAYVLSVYVVPPQRRRGVLRALVRHAEAWCRDRGITEMRLHAGLQNRAGNAAWAALGFEPAEILRVRRLPVARKRPRATAS
jgi:GNAT superfamily N-acetyltransferase